MFPFLVQSVVAGELSEGQNHYVCVPLATRGKAVVQYSSHLRGGPVEWVLLIKTVQHCRGGNMHLFTACLRRSLQVMPNAKTRNAISAENNYKKGRPQEAPLHY